MLLPKTSATQMNENAEGVPDISRGLSDQRERYPRVSDHPCTLGLEGCKIASFTTRAVRPLQGREIGLSDFRGCRFAQPPANFSHPFRMTDRGSVSRSTLRATDALGLSMRWAAGKAPAGHRPALLWLRLRRAALYRRVALCEASGKAHVWVRSDGLPNKIRRYGRLKICATDSCVLDGAPTTEPQASAIQVLCQANGRLQIRP